MSMLQARLDKIEFLVREIDLAGHLALLCAGNDELARIWARRALLRCADLIAHTEKIRRDILAHKADYRSLKETRVAYDDLFNEHFRVVRDRIAAHLQDIDLLDRIAVWNRIDAASVSVFVDGAHEIYDRCLGGMSLPGFLPFASFPERTDENLARDVRVHVARSASTAPSIGVDAFAAARPNTATLINTTALHERAQMVVALRRWIVKVAPFAFDARVGLNVQRLARAELITDLVAMGDCFFTRGVNGPQQMDGLDVLLEGAAAEVFRRWDRNTKLRAMAEELRDVRNTITAHLDVDPATSLTDLVARLDAVDLPSLARTFDRFSSLFHDVCAAEIRLRSYLMDGSPLRGVLSVSHAADHRPYTPSGTPPQALPPQVRIDPQDADAIDDALEGWCRGDDDEALGSALWQVSNEGPVVSQVATSGPRSISLKPFHTRFALRLGNADTQAFGRLMELAVRLGRNAPIPLVEAMLSAIETRGATVHERALVATALSRIPLRADESDRVEPFLGALVDCDLEVAHPALVAHYQLAVMKRPEQKEPCAGGLLELIAERSSSERAAGIAALIGHVWSGSTYASSSTLDADARLLADATANLVPHDQPPAEAERVRNVAYGDPCGLLVLLAELHKEEAERGRLLRSATATTITLPRDRGLRRKALLNRASAYCMLGDVDAARALCDQVLAALDLSQPAECVDVLAHCTACGVAPAQWVDLIRDTCVLDDEDRRRLEALTDGTV